MIKLCHEFAQKHGPKPNETRVTPTHLLESLTG